MSFADLRKKMAEDPDFKPEVDDALKKFFEHVKKTEINDLTDDDFKPKVVWFNKAGVPKVTMFPHVDEADGGDWVGALPHPMAILSAAQEDIERVCIVSDSIGTTHMTKADGSNWEHGEMQVALRDPSNPDHDKVQETLMVNAVLADGTVATATCPYTRHDDGPITFDTDDILWSVKPDENEGMGRVPDTMRWALTRPKLSTLFDEHLGGVKGTDFGLTQVEADAHQLCAVIKMVMQQYRWVCLVGASSQEEADVFKDSFNNGPFSEGIRAFDEEAAKELVSLEESWNAS